MNAREINALHKSLATLGRIAERTPSMVAVPAWQMASEGIARLIKEQQAFRRAKQSIFRKMKRTKRKD